MLFARSSKHPQFKLDVRIVAAAVLDLTTEVEIAWFEALAAQHQPEAQRQDGGRQDEE